VASLPLSARLDVDRPDLLVSWAYGIMGRPDRARSILNSYNAAMTDTAVQRIQGPSIHLALGEILLAERKPLDAIVEFRKSDVLPDGPSNDCLICLYWALGRAFDATNQPDSAIAMYERYLAEPNYARFDAMRDGVALPYIRRRLGELYEAKGDVAKATVQYRAFVDLWKNADPELQVRVSEVKRKLGRLSDLEGRR
jgi:tetratricopeptide (TPR) repeat protein